jgi:hypothetical protein
MVEHYCNHWARQKDYLPFSPLKTTPIWRCRKANKTSLKQEIVNFSFTVKTKNASLRFRRDLAGLFVELFQKEKLARSERAEKPPKEG